jgi:hypothetical protein
MAAPIRCQILPDATHGIDLIVVPRERDPQPIVGKSRRPQLVPFH